MNKTEWAVLIFVIMFTIINFLGVFYGLRVARRFSDWLNRKMGW